MAWISNNSDVLMLIITFVYVIATCFICYFNAKSAYAAKHQIEEVQKQIAESQAQQRQNVGIQLYEKRKEILKKFSDEKYNVIYWDIPILFSSSINSDFQKLYSVQDQYDRVFKKFEKYVDRLKEKPEAYNQFCNLMSQAAELGDYSQVYKFCEQYNFTEVLEITDEVETYNFKELEETVLALRVKKESAHTLIFLAMQKFIKTSISLEE